MNDINSQVVRIALEKISDDINWITSRIDWAILNNGQTDVGIELTGKEKEILLEIKDYSRGINSFIHGFVIALGLDK